MPDEIAPPVPVTAVVPVTSDGFELEAEARIPDAPVAAVVLAHPHPQMGGSMRSIVTSELFRQLPLSGIAAIRFNFRGVERSQGEYGHGRAERADIVAAIDALIELLDERGLWDPVSPLPLVLCGWSFGADVSLSVADARLRAWFLIASPLRILPLDELVAAHDPRPKVFAIPENDDFRRPDAVREMTSSWTNVTVHEIPGAGHYLVGKTGAVATLLTDLVSTLT